MLLLMPDLMLLFTVKDPYSPWGEAVIQHKLKNSGLRGFELKQIILRFRNNFLFLYMLTSYSRCNYVFKVMSFLAIFKFYNEQQPCAVTLAHTGS